ncbi:hypothetical protein K491DRAFT_782753 [Lophiostoma macrostomum CBS 122681]|uniref:ZZ-type domain-containing protein n=1 Tax=Lophiostoma macrostomum CBS 122681 TaxID=1314788 RepID=A0A6A6SRV3_9PLEO|nr:hypothetical protein K491DRAFT_782753 [Lophiostoma macrostomum CBS 122681]
MLQIEVDRDIHKDWDQNHFPSLEGFANAGFIGYPYSARGRSPFLALLDRGMRFKSTDPRDKIFALLHHRVGHEMYDKPNGRLVATKVYPLAGQNVSNPYIIVNRMQVGLELVIADPNCQELCTHFGIRPDYEKNIREVYREVASLSIQQYQCLDVLNHGWKTSHSNRSWPSWIPRWDFHKPIPVPVLDPVIYSASNGSGPIVHWDHTNPDRLAVQGLNLGSLRIANTILEHEIISSELDGRVIDDRFGAVTKLTTLERWFSTSGKYNGERSGPNMQNQINRIATHALRLLENRKETIYIPLNSVQCDQCEEYISGLDGAATSTSTSYYHCLICHLGDFDICTACYSTGKRCEVPSHTLREQKVPSLRLLYTKQIFGILRTYSADASYDGRNPMLSSEPTFFFKTSRGDRGTAYWTVEPGDVVVVLFGSQLPFIMRKTGASYRLISSCYLLGMMDGEAMDLWRNGKLQEETFYIT